MVDLVAIEDGLNILLELKSLRPSLALTTYWREEGLEAIGERVTKALVQAIVHAQAIDNREWNQISPQQAVEVIVTFGRVRTVNGPFTRKRVTQLLEAKGLPALPYVGQRKLLLRQAKTLETLRERTDSAHAARMVALFDRHHRAVEQEIMLTERQTS
jgi:hypothetical protein